MGINYYHKNIESLDLELKSYIEKKLNSIEKMVDLNNIKVEVSERRDSVFMAVTIFTKNGNEFRAENNGSTFQECIDKIEDELKNQIRREKGKENDLKKRGGISLKKKMTIDESARF